MLGFCGNKVLRKTSSPKNDEVRSNLGHYTTRNLVIYTGHVVLLGHIARMEKQGMHIEFCWGTS
jgi:hypothetical protein